jgi:hypothetical protein
MVTKYKKLSRTDNFRKAFLVKALVGASIIPMSTYASWDNVTPKKYGPTIQLEGKIGNNRNIARPSALIPLAQNDKNVMHLSLIGMNDTNGELEGNAGVGFRSIINNNILGFYGFIDSRKSEHNNVMHQATLGMEWFKDYIDVRFNIYLPENKDFTLASSTKQPSVGFKANTFQVRTDANVTLEKAIPGFDIDIGAQIPGLDMLTARAAYYRFASDAEGFADKVIKGGRGVVDLKVSNFLNANIEVAYDTQRNWNVFGGVTLSHHFGGGKNGYSSLSRLEKKMTSLPIRDIDIISLQGNKTITKSHESVALLPNEENTTFLVVGKNFITAYDVDKGKMTKTTAINDRTKAAVSTMIRNENLEDQYKAIFYVDGKGNVNKALYMDGDKVVKDQTIVNAIKPLATKYVEVEKVEEEVKDKTAVEVEDGDGSFADSTNTTPVDEGKAKKYKSDSKAPGNIEENIKHARNKWSSFHNPKKESTKVNNLREALIHTVRAEVIALGDKDTANMTRKQWNDKAKPFIKQLANHKINQITTDTIESAPVMPEHVFNEAQVALLMKVTTTKMKTVEEMRNIGSDLPLTTETFLTN